MTLTKVDAESGRVAGRSRARSWVASLAFAFPLLLYLWLPASVINGDGIKYLYDTINGSYELIFIPGHLLYCPFMAVLGWVGGWHTPSALARVMLLSNQVAGAYGVYLQWRTAKQLGLDVFGRWVAALGLALSYGFWIQATDVETYAIAVLFVIASMHQMALYAKGGLLKQLVALGTLNGLAALFHLTSIFLIPSSIYLIARVERRQPDRLAKAIGLYLLSIGFSLVLPVLIIGFGLLKLSTIIDLFIWLKSSDHGDPVILDILSFPRAIYGFSRTFLYLEFFWEAPKWIITLKCIALLMAGVWILRRLGATSHQSLPEARTVLASMSIFALFQAILGIYYFGSDTERWIFIAPLVWQVISGCLSHLAPAQRGIASAVLIAMATLNTVQAFWPNATDSSTEDKVRALDEVVPAGALVITPGHDWISYYNFFTHKKMYKVTLIEIATESQGSGRLFFGRLDKLIARAKSEGKDIILIRILDNSENYRTTPWPLIAALGYSPPQVCRWFRRYDWDERRLGDRDRTRTYWLRSEPREGFR